MHQDVNFEPVLISEVVVQAPKVIREGRLPVCRYRYCLGYQAGDVRILIVLLNGDRRWIKAGRGNLAPGKWQAGRRIVDDTEDAGSKYPCFMAAVGTVVTWVDYLGW